MEKDDEIACCLFLAFIGLLFFLTFPTYHSTQIFPKTPKIITPHVPITLAGIFGGRSWGRGK